MNAVEQYARTQIVTDADTPQAVGHEAVTVTLCYDAERDPRTVTVRMPGPGNREWSLPRELLERGLRTPVGNGDVQVWPCGRVQTVVEFHSAQGVSVVEFDTKALARFLRRTYAAAATEPVPH